MSRSRLSSRNPTTPRSSSRIPYSSEALILPNGAIGHDTLVLDPASEQSSLDDEDNEDEHLKRDLEHRRLLPWWKRPSASWILIMVPLISVTLGMVITPRIEIITQLVCRTLRPGHSAETNSTETCSSDPVVQAVTARFLAVMSIAPGVLSSLTAAWWGSRSDRKGRASTLRIFVLGLLVADVAFICVYTFLDKLPGGYWFLLIGAIAEGVLGGMSAMTANLHAYIADCTEPAKRSRTFSLYLGLLFSGLAVGPTLGSLIIHMTHEVISVYYISTALHVLYAFAIWFILPESLFPRQLARASQNYIKSRRSASSFGLRTLSSFFSPLHVFIPVQKARNDLSRRRLDWNLTLLAGAYGAALMMVGAYQFKVQYASLRFSWSSEILGYWMSAVNFSRAIFLTLILPTIIALFKRKKKAPAHSYTEPSGRSHPEISLPPSDVQQPMVDQEETPLLSSETSANDSRHDDNHNTPAIDLNIVRISLLVDLMGYVLIVFTASGPLFTLWSVVGSFGTGFLPSVQSLALALYTSRGGTETGSLFGAMSVVNSVGGQLISPALFGYTFAETANSFPQALYVVCAAATLCSLVLISLVQLPKEEGPGIRADYEAANGSHPESVVPNETEEN